MTFRERGPTTRYWRHNFTDWIVRVIRVGPKGSPNADYRVMAGFYELGTFIKRETAVDHAERFLREHTDGRW